MFALYVYTRYDDGDDDPESVALLHKYSFWGLNEVFVCVYLRVRVCVCIVTSLSTLRIRTKQKLNYIFFELISVLMLN